MAAVTITVSVIARTFPVRNRMMDGNRPWNNMRMYHNGCRRHNSRNRNNRIGLNSHWRRCGNNRHSYIDCPVCSSCLGRYWKKYTTNRTERANQFHEFYAFHFRPLFTAINISWSHLTPRNKYIQDHNCKSCNIIFHETRQTGRLPGFKSREKR